MDLARSPSDGTLMWSSPSSLCGRSPQNTLQIKVVCAKACRVEPGSRGIGASFRRISLLSPFNLVQANAESFGLQTLAYDQALMRLGRRNNAIHRPTDRLVAQSGMQYACAFDSHIPRTHHSHRSGRGRRIITFKFSLLTKETDHG